MFKFDEFGHLLCQICGNPINDREYDSDAQTYLNVKYAEFVIADCRFCIQRVAEQKRMSVRLTRVSPLFHSPSQISKEWRFRLYREFGF